MKLYVVVFCVSAVGLVSGDALEPPGLMSPSSTVRSLTKELQHSLDLASATSGDKVVTAQVSDPVNLNFLLVLIQSFSEINLFIA